MMKRNITIVGIVLILIVVAIIGVVIRSDVRVRSAEVREPVALSVGSVVVEQASVASSVPRDVPADMVELVGASVVSRTVEAHAVARTVVAVGPLAVQPEKDVNLAVFERADVMGVERVRVTLV